MNKKVLTFGTIATVVGLTIAAGVLAQSGGNPTGAVTPVRPPNSQIIVQPAVPTINVNPTPVNVQPANPTVNVQPAVPNITVEPSVPNITVEPASPNITIEPAQVQVVVQKEPVKFINLNLLTAFHNVPEGQPSVSNVNVAFIHSVAPFYETVNGVTTVVGAVVELDGGASWYVNETPTELLTRIQALN